MLSESYLPASLLIAVLAPWALHGQQPQALIAGPGFGFVYDEAARGLKPLLGNPAAAMIGPPLALGAPLAAAVISPRQDYALAVTASDRGVVLVRLDGNSPQTSSLSLLPASPDRLTLSPGGGAAALYYAAARNIQVITGLPDAPVFSSVDAAALPGAPDVLAVSDDGQALLAGFNGASSGQVYLLAGAAPQAVFEAGSIAAIAFLNGSHDALVADGVGNAVMRLAGAGAEPAVLARQADGIDHPAAVAASLDNRLALVANAGSASVAVIDLSAAKTAVVACRCAPTAMARLTGQSLFRLNGPSTQPIALLDAGGSRPTVEVIPPEPQNARPTDRIPLPERGIRQ